MPKVFCNTSPLQYLHQMGLLGVLRQLTPHLIVPGAVAQELETGLRNGWNVPDLKTLDWIEIKNPARTHNLPAVTDLGPGETSVICLALESTDCLVIIDDGLGRRISAQLGLRFTGTLGLLLDAKRAGLIPAVAPFLNQLNVLRFRLAPSTRDALLKLAGEA